jgi:hypothetical protein
MRFVLLVSLVFAAVVGVVLVSHKSTAGIESCPYPHQICAQFANTDPYNFPLR